MTKILKVETQSHNLQEKSEPFTANLKYMVWGVVFGVIFVKAEIISWFRIQEMFRFQSFHMFGVIGTAVLTGMISVFLLKKLKIKTLAGETIKTAEKTFDKGTVIGSLIFGFGWAITGACPGPLYAHLGTGYLSALITFSFALIGTWVYGRFRLKLPH